MKIEHIYRRLICGGIGYAPTLYRIGAKYYTVRGDVDPDGLRVLSQKVSATKRRRNGYALWLRHKDDHELTASEFLRLLEDLEK